MENGQCKKNLSDIERVNGIRASKIDLKSFYVVQKLSKRNKNVVGFH